MFLAACVCFAFHSEYSGDRRVVNTSVSVSVPSALHNPMNEGHVLLVFLSFSASCQQAGRMSPSQFARISGLVSNPLAPMNPKLLQGRAGQMMSPASGFRAFFGAQPPPAPPSQHHAPCPGAHLQNLRYPACFRQTSMRQLSR